MGRINGFLCGSVISASIIYLSTLRMQSDYSANSLKLQEYRLKIESLHYPPQRPQPMQFRIGRPSFRETLKDAWNSEIEQMVKRVQEIDWVKVREGVEDSVENIWEKARKKVQETKGSS